MFVDYVYYKRSLYELRAGPKLGRGTTSHDWHMEEIVIKTVNQSETTTTKDSKEFALPFPTRWSWFLSVQLGRPE